MLERSAAAWASRRLLCVSWAAGKPRLNLALAPRSAVWAGQLATREAPRVDPVLQGDPVIHHAEREEIVIAETPLDPYE
jgi:hypothetical protein